MKVYMALGELEALKADQEFEYLEGKLALYQNAIEKAKKEADLEGAAPSPSKDQKKDKVDLDDLYRNQSPLFDFLSDRVNPRTFYVESKEVINPHDMEDRTCVKHNEDFKVKSFFILRIDLSKRDMRSLRSLTKVMHPQRMVARTVKKMRIIRRG